jgi:hypothetical protein
MSNAPASVVRHSGIATDLQHPAVGRHHNKWGGRDFLAHLEPSFFFADLGGLGQFGITMARLLLIRWLATERGGTIVGREDVKFSAGDRAGRAWIGRRRIEFVVQRAMG